LAINGLPVHLFGGSLSVFLAIEGDEGEPLAGVVDISHHAELLELCLKISIGHVLVNSIDEELATFLSHDSVDDVWILLEMDSVLQRF